MKLSSYTIALNCAGAAVAMRLADNADRDPASWCFTYLSDVLVPVSALPEHSASINSLLSGHLSLTSESGDQTAILSASSEPKIQSEISYLSGAALTPTSPALTNSYPSTPITSPGSGTSTSVTTSPTPNVPSTREIILFIYPTVEGRKLYLEARANTGFLNNDAAESEQRCDNATVFTLASGQLSDSGSPIHYFPGDNYKQLRSAGPLPVGAISTNFTIERGFLEFSNTSLPGGGASFCENGDGNVYMTFTSSPLECEPVFLTSYGVELCQNGEIVGADLPGARSTEVNLPPASTRTGSQGGDNFPAATTALSSLNSAQKSSETPGTTFKDGTSSVLGFSTSASRSTVRSSDEAAHPSHILSTTPTSFGASLTRSMSSHDAYSEYPGIPSTASLQSTMISPVSSTTPTTLSASNSASEGSLYSPALSSTTMLMVSGTPAPEPSISASTTSALGISASSLSQPAPSSQSPNSDRSTSWGTSKASLTPTEATSSSEHERLSKTTGTESTAKTTSRPGIEISFSLSPTTSEAQISSSQSSNRQPSIPQFPSLQTPSLQTPSLPISSPQGSEQLSSFSDQKTTRSKGTATGTTGLRSDSSADELSTAGNPASSTSGQTTSALTSTSTPVCEEGLEYAVYFFGPGSPECEELARTTQGGDPLDLDLTTVIGNKIPRTVGRYPELDVSGASVGDQCVVVELRGYIVLNETGQYALNILGTVYDLAYVWYGDAALSGRFEPSNSALRKFRDSQQSALTSVAFAESASTQHTPIRIFMGSPILAIWLQISAQLPSGNGTSFVTCSGRGNAPGWEPWEQELVGTRSPPSTHDHLSVTSSSSSMAPSATPSRCLPGVEYAVYLFDSGSAECAQLQRVGDTQDLFSLNLETIIQGKAPQGTGTVVTDTMGFLQWNDDDTDEAEPIQVHNFTGPSGKTSGNTCMAIEYRGYLTFPEEGQLSVSLSDVDYIDDMVFVWIGETALSDQFKPGNSQLSKLKGLVNRARSSSSEFSQLVPGLSMYMPLRVFYADAGGGGRFRLSIVGDESNTPTLVTCSEDLSDEAPAWPPWDEEGISITSSSSSASSTAEETTSTALSTTPISTPTPVCEDGVEYAVYFFKNDGTGECQELYETYSTQDPFNLNLARIIEGKAPHATGITPNVFGLDFDPQPGERTTIYDYTTPSDIDASAACTVVSHRGYLVVSNPYSPYPLQIDAEVDDLIYVWGDDAALSGGFNPSNSIIRKVRDTWNNGQAYHNFGVDDATRVKRDGTRYIPIRVLYTNFDGAGQFRLSTAGFPAPQFVTCSGDQVAPSWLPWEQERTSPVCTPGLEYAIYTYDTNSPEYDLLAYTVQYTNPLVLDLKALIENKVTRYIGHTGVVEWATLANFDEFGPITIYDFEGYRGEWISNTCVVIQHRGFVQFHGPGTYTFEITGDPDTIFFVWLGVDALPGNFYPANSQLAKLYQSDIEARMTYSFTASDTDKYLPIRAIYANLVGHGEFKLSITGPTGTPPPSLVQCFGTKVVPEWLPWIQEEVAEGVVQG